MNNEEKLAGQISRTCSLKQDTATGALHIEEWTGVV